MSLTHKKENVFATTIEYCLKSAELSSFSSTLSAFSASDRSLSAGLCPVFRRGLALLESFHIHQKGLLYLHSLSSRSNASSMCSIHLLKLSHSFYMFHSVFLILCSLWISAHNFFWPNYKIASLFFSYVKFMVKSIKYNLHFCHAFCDY